MSRRAQIGEGEAGPLFATRAATARRCSKRPRDLRLAPTCSEKPRPPEKTWLFVRSAATTEIQKARVSPGRATDPNRYSSPEPRRIPRSRDNPDTKMNLSSSSCPSV